MRPIGIPRSSIYTTPSSCFYHTAWEKAGGWCRQRSLGFDEPERTLRTSPDIPRIPVEENNYEPKIYQKNVRGEQDAVLPETYEKKRTGIQKTGRFTDEQGAGTDRSGDLHR